MDISVLVKCGLTSGEQDAFLTTADLLEADSRSEGLILSLSGSLRP